MSKTTQTQPTDDDILNPKVATSCLDFLLIELVPLVQRVTDQLQAREQALLDEYRRSKIFIKSNNRNSVQSTKDGEVGTQSIVVDGDVRKAGVTNGEVEENMTTLGFPEVKDPSRDALYFRLDSIGYRVGQGLVERFSAGKPRPQSDLDAIKFLCKDLWTLLFKKQIDNLKTNHRGIFVLTDNRFQPLSRMSVDRRAGPKALEESLSRAQLYLCFPAGVVRGALQGLGIEAAVSAESTEIPTAAFQIKTKGAKA